MFFLDCNRIIQKSNYVQPNDEIFSPNYPRNYPSSILCNWTILGDTTKPLERIFIEFAEFKLDSQETEKSVLKA